MNNYQFVNQMQPQRYVLSNSESIKHIPATLNGLPAQRLNITGQGVRRRNPNLQLLKHLAKLQRKRPVKRKQNKRKRSGRGIFLPGRGIYLPGMGIRLPGY